MHFHTFLWNFIKELTTWVTGSVFVAYYALTQWEILPKIPYPYEGRILLGFVLTAIVISFYRIWAKEYRNPVDHRITCTIRKINFDFISETYEVTDDEITQIRENLSKWDEWEQQFTPEQRANLVGHGAHTREQCEEYLRSIESYKRNLESFKQEIQDCYFLDCYIHNHGTMMDSQISIGISGAEESQDTFKFYKHVDDLCSPPEKPWLDHGSGTGRHVRDIVWGTYEGDPPQERWLSHHIGIGHISVELTDLKVGTGFHFIYHDAILKSSEDTLELKYWISSAKTKKRIDGKLIIDLANAKSAWPLVEE